MFWNDKEEREPRSQQLKKKKYMHQLMSTEKVTSMSPSKFCWCLSLRQGCFVVGVASLVGNVLLLYETGASVGYFHIILSPLNLLGMALAVFLWVCVYKRDVKLLSAWVFFQGVVLVSTVLATVVMFASRGLPEGDWQADAGVLLEEGVVVLAEIGLGTYFIVVVNAYREHLQWQQLQQQQRPESETEPLAK